MKADWVSVDQAIHTVLWAMRELGAQPCELRAARGRVLAEDLVAPIELPRWTNSAMDGFAVYGDDVVSASEASPVELPIVEEIAAGSFPLHPLKRGTAARIMTGAPLPDGADSVVRIEHTDGGRDSGGAYPLVTIFSGLDATRNLRRKGEEIGVGSIALRAGSVMSPAALGVAASLGWADVSVYRKPRVALLTSGDELVDLDGFEEVLAGKKIVSSNTYTLTGMLEEIGCEVINLGIARDCEESLRKALAHADGCDALVTSAGISVGAHDHVKSVLLSMGAAVKFWRVLMRPGSPFAFGTIGGLGGIPWFGLPGNPVSSAVTFELFARPALLRMAGHRNVFRRVIYARLLDDYLAPNGLTQFVRVTLDREGEVAVARLTGSQGSGILSSVAAADGLMVIGEEREGAAAGESYPVILLGSGGLQGEAGF